MHGRIECLELEVWSDYRGLECQSKGFKLFSVTLWPQLGDLNRVCFREINLGFHKNEAEGERPKMRGYQNGPNDGYSESVIS